MKHRPIGTSMTVPGVYLAVGGILDLKTLVRYTIRWALGRAQ